MGAVASCLDGEVRFSPSASSRYTVIGEVGVPGAVLGYPPVNPPPLRSEPCPGMVGTLSSHAARSPLAQFDEFVFCCVMPGDKGDCSVCAEAQRYEQATTPVTNKTSSISLVGTRARRIRTHLEATCRTLATEGTSFVHKCFLVTLLIFCVFRSCSSPWVSELDVSELFRVFRPLTCIG